MTTLTRDELVRMIAEGVELAFERMGIDVEDKAAMRADFVHLRRWRLYVETMVTWAGKTAIGILVVGICSALWAMLRMDFHPK